MSLISTENPISSSALSDHSHSTFTAGVSCTAAITTSQKMFLNDMRIFCDGENISNEVTGAFLSKTSLTKFGDGTQNHQFNTTAGSGPMDITSQIATVGQHYFIFKQSGLNQGGRIRYYLYVTY